jgi:hypothetical protein
VINLILRFTRQGGLYTVLRGRTHFSFVRVTPDQGVREMDLVLVIKSWRSTVTFFPLISMD